MRKRLLAMLLTMCLLINIAPSVFAVDQSTSKYSGKIISIMGDSISTFSGQPHSEKNRYPENAKGSGVDTVDDTWWMQLINELDATLGICEARGSSTVTNIYDEMTSDGRKGPTIAMASWDRINDLSANGIPDVILFYGGTNDKNAVYRDDLYEMGTFNPETAPALENYDPEADTAIKWNNVVEGFVAAILRMKATYPDAELIALLPINGSANGFNTEIQKIYDHYGITTVSLTNVTSTGLWDTLHPNAYGMDIITAEVKAIMLGETVEYPMYPNAQIREIPVDAYNDTNLWPDDPDSGYYKGKAWNTKYKSITLPVTEGDKVYASSFQSSSVTGGTSNGIAVTYLKEGKVTQSIAPDDVYAAYTANGYLTVPADVDAISIPMWADDENAVVNILNLPKASNSDTDDSTPEDDTSSEVPGDELRNDYLWELPSVGIYNTTNLWELAVAEGKVGQGYYKSGVWTDHSSHHSITIPVEPGDRFFASSFQARGINGHTSNDGIVLTYLYGNTSTKNLTYADVYGEFEKYGYLTVPDDIQVNAVNIVTWNTASNNPVVLLLDRPDDPIVNPHGGPEKAPVQQLPDEAYSDTNLWQYYKDKGVLTSGGYYSGAGVWTSSSNYYSVTVPVEPGDKFTTGALAGDGLVVSFWYGNHYVIGYSKANANKAHDAHGYLTVPGGVNAVNIILSKTQSNSTDSGYFKILTLPTRITSADLTIPAPVTEVAPITELSGTGYTGEIIWSPEISGTFDAKTVYTANITLSALDNNKFTENFVVTVNGEVAAFTISSDGKIASGTVTFAETEEVLNSHLQWVDDDSNLYSDTNLWTELNPVKEYHTGTKWRYDHATVYSVTIPVKEGDKIYASSFQAKPVNGGTSSGIAVAFFYGEDVVASLSPEQTYAEWSEYGYITVPAGVNAVCIPMWKNNENAVVNLLTLPDRPGEVSGDGEVDETDAMILARYLAGWSGYEDKIVSMEAADLNGDGKVSDIDAMILARYLAGWPNYDEYFK